jgi:hypothetical protein
VVQFCIEAIEEVYDEKSSDVEEIVGQILD